MFSKYLGHLNHHSSLHGYLRDQVVHQMGTEAPSVDFRIFQSDRSHNVYLYEEKFSAIRFVGKFYPPKNREFQQHHPRYQPEKGKAEFNNLMRLRGLGFDSPPHYVVKPLGFNPACGNLLLMEFLDGDLLGTLINRAIHHGEQERLYHKLTALASFLATLHNRTAGAGQVDFEPSYAYMGQLIASLITKRGMARAPFDELFQLRELWREKGVMWEDQSVLVHGDVTPSNILFGEGQTVLAIDFERMQRADRVFDLGRLCGELAHFFYEGQGDRQAAEPFIGHFLWEYSGHFPDRMSAFRSITKRIPFYMGITLLRIGRNVWIKPDYRWKLVQETKKILRGLP